MNWFLFQADEGSLQGAPPTGKEILCVTQSRPLNAENVQKGSLVKFLHNNVIVEGKLLEQAKDRLILKDQMRNRIIRSLDHFAGKYMLVQYSDQSNILLLHEIVQEKDVNCSTDNFDYHPQVIVRGNRIATVIVTAHAERYHIEKVKSEIKDKCYDEVFDQHLQKDRNIDDNTWLLVQGSYRKLMIHAVINYSKTVWKKDNLYKNVVAYIELDNETVLHTVILSSSQDKSKMEAKLKHLTDYCMFLNVPEKKYLAVRSQIDKVAAVVNSEAIEELKLFVRNRAADTESALVESLSAAEVSNE